MSIPVRIELWVSVLADGALIIVNISTFYACDPHWEKGQVICQQDFPSYVRLARQTQGLLSYARGDPLQKSFLLPFQLIFAFLAQPSRYDRGSSSHSQLKEQTWTNLPELPNFI